MRNNRFETILRTKLPLALATLLILIFTSLLLYFSLNRNDKRLIYAIDDPYIHMAIGKNLIHHAVWGVTPYEFSSSSSSPLWTFLIAFFFLFIGIKESIPFLLNLFAAVSLLYIVDHYLIKLGMSPPFRTGILSGMILLAPLPPLIFTGMEPILQMVLVIPFIFLSSEILSKEHKPVVSRVNFILFSLSALLSMVRFESLFLIFIAVVLFYLRGRKKYAAVLLLSGLGPALVYGIISVVNGWYILPNPVLLKANIRGLEGWGGFLNLLGWAGLKQMWYTPHLFFLWATGLFIYISNLKKGFWEKSRLSFFLWMCTVALHMQFARTGWFFRYESYLVVSGLLILIPSLRDIFGPACWKESPRLGKIMLNFLIAITLILSMAFLGMRSFDAFRWTPLATSNIYQQQYQMGQFLKEFYDGKPVAANDIGAICFLSDVNCLDLWGAANMEVARLKKDNRLDLAQIRRITMEREVQIAVIYDDWFMKDGERKIPLEWLKVGVWTIKNNIVCGGDSVSFYAVDSTSASSLIQNLQRYSPRLPAGVIQDGTYLDMISIWSPRNP
ncbi:MAG: hypothetical protein NTV06_05205 [candidate division Zixibacteria bacterium]|nr:hypothetical protein [candidate division Zixibacteria bacterium]